MWTEETFVFIVKNYGCVQTNRCKNQNTKQTETQGRRCRPGRERQEDWAEGFTRDDEGTRSLGGLVQPGKAPGTSLLQRRDSKNNGLYQTPGE